MRTVVGGLAGWFLITCLTLTGAAAHGETDLVASFPAPGQSLGSVPGQVVLEFSAPLQRGTATLTVRAPSGKERRLDPRLSIAGDVAMGVMEPRGRDGRWQLEFTGISADGGVVAVTVPFTVGDPVLSSPSGLVADGAAWLVVCVVLMLAIGCASTLRLLREDDGLTSDFTKR